MPSISLSNFELTRFFSALILLLASAHFFGHFFQHFKFPRVIGEIFGGLLLGPTFLGHFFPAAHQWLFFAFDSEGKLISAIYWFGLVLLMFVSGFEIQKSLNQSDKRTILALIGSTFFLFLAGWFATDLFHLPRYMGFASSSTAFKMIVGISTAVTSIPVISKIFIDLNIMQTRFAKIILAAATAHDILLWIVLAVATGLVGNEIVSKANILLTVLTTLAFFVVTIVFLPRLIRIGNGLRINLVFKSSTLGYVLLICFLFSTIASILNVNVVFGALLAGIAIGLMPNDIFAKEKTYIREMSFGFFVPLYFGIVGLKLDLVHHFDFLFLIGFLLITTALVILWTLLAARWAGQNWLSSLNLGMAMNARGGPGIVLATVALELGIINETFFSTLVLTAILTSLFAGVWLRVVLSKGWPLLGETNA